MKVKEESGKVGLKLNIQKTKITASSPITSWEIDGETVETVSDFILGAPKSLHHINNLRYADDTTLMAESEEELKKPLDESETGERKSWLEAQHSENKDRDIWSHHFMGNRWGNSGNSVRLYFGGLQNHCRW